MQEEKETSKLGAKSRQSGRSSAMPNLEGCTRPSSENLDQPSQIRNRIQQSTTHLVSLNTLARAIEEFLLEKELITLLPHRHRNLDGTVRPACGHGNIALDALS